MGILNSFERVLGIGRPPAEATRVALKEIFCNRRDGEYIKRFRTAAAGTQYHNPDGSDRQAALTKIKVGDRVRLIWEAGDGGKIEKVHLLRRGRRKQLNMPDCFGRLDDKTAADVVRWLNKDRIATAARVVSITGGDRKKAKLGCVLELTTYPMPEKGRWLSRRVGRR
jgi:hypothetical protein